MRGLNRFNRWNLAFFKPFYVASENIGSLLLRNSKSFFILNLKSKATLNDYFTLFKSYENYEQYLVTQQIKTKRRLKVFSSEYKSIMWTSQNDIKYIAKVIKNYIHTPDVSGLCMGSRSGEEQLLFRKFLGGKSKVLGVELTPDAKSLPSTIIADFHYPPKELLGKFDFVYSNSHDQAFNPRLAITAWIKCLKKEVGLLILEHSRAHGKMGAGRQDPFGIETEILPYVMLRWFPNKIQCVLIAKAHSNQVGHEIIFFQKV